MTALAPTVPRRTAPFAVALVAILVACPVRAQIAETPGATEPTNEIERSVPNENPSADGNAIADPLYRQVNLAELLREARRSYPGARAANRRIDIARTLLDEARWSPFFQIQALGFVTAAPQARGNVIFSPDSQLPLGNQWYPAAGGSIRGAIPFFTFGKLSSLRDAAAAGIQAAEGDQDRTNARLVFDVRRAYFGLLLALDARQMLSEATDALDRAKRKLDESLESGEGEFSDTDRFRISATVAEVAARSSEVARLEEIARAGLTALTGVEAFEPPACPLVEVTYTLASVAEYEESARENRPELRMLAAGIRAREAALAIARAQFAPDFAVAFEVGGTTAPGFVDQTTPFAYDPLNNPSLSGSIVARYSLDVPGNFVRMQRAEYELRETEDRVEEARRGIRVEVRAAVATARDARNRVDAWRSAERDTRGWLVASLQSYQVGTLETQDLIDAVKGYFAARFSAMQARHDYNVAIADLERIAGRELVPAGSWDTACD